MDSDKINAIRINIEDFTKNMIIKSNENHKAGELLEEKELYDAAISRYYYSIYQRIRVCNITKNEYKRYEELKERYDNLFSILINEYDQSIIDAIIESDTDYKELKSLLSDDHKKFISHTTMIKTFIENCNKSTKKYDKVIHGILIKLRQYRNIADYAGLKRVNDIFEELKKEYCIVRDIINDLMKENSIIKEIAKKLGEENVFY